MKLKIVWIGKTKSAAVQSLTDEYLQRLMHYADVEAKPLREATALLSAYGPDSRNGRSTLVILDAGGKQFSSEELAGFLGDYQTRNPLPLVFAIGGADGFSEPVRRQATLLLSLGRITLAHELARVVLLEQLYRAFTILKGHPYHLGH